jgi:hypothetical protein
MGTYLRLMLAAAISAFAVWFWYSGITVLPQAPCEEVIFFFKKLEVLGPIRTFYKIGSVVFLLYYGTLALVGILTIVKYLLPTSGPRQPDSDLKFWETYRKVWLDKEKIPLDRGR